VLWRREKFLATARNQPPIPQLSNPQPLAIVNGEKQVQSEEAEDRGDFPGNAEEDFWERKR
jgi:hypothetical protein